MRFHMLMALCALVCLATSVSCSNYFPEGVKLAKVDVSKYVDTPGLQDFDMPTPGLTEHPARYLPVNHTKARFYTCPWAFAAPPGRLFGRLKAGVRAGARALGGGKGRACGATMSGNDGGEVNSGRRGFMLLAGLAALGGGGGGAGAKSPTIRDMMNEAEEEKRKKAEYAASLPQRPTELKDKPTCFTWNGEKKCFSCVTECEYYKTLNPKLDCNKWCTVEYGQAKPTDEDSISFNEFVAGVDAKAVERVDFYGYSGDKAYATFKDGKRIRIGEGFPIEIGNEASSPLFVARLLAQKGVPYEFHFLDGIKYKKMGAP